MFDEFLVVVWIVFRKCLGVIASIHSMWFLYVFHVVLLFADRADPIWDPILWNLNVRIFFVPFVASICDRVLKHLGPVRERYRLRNKCSKDVSGDDLAEHIGTCLQ